MTATGFEQFAEAVSAGSSAKKAVGAPLSFDRVTVLGGGNDALMLAALCLAEGTEVTLFSAYGRELDALRNGHGVSLRGDGPVGNYQVDQDAVPSIRTTAEIDRAVADAEVIFLTGPIHKQRTYAMVLADHIKDGQVLVLAPGRSLGAAEVSWLLRVGGAEVDFTLVDVLGLPYWFDVTGNQFTLSAAGPMKAATLPSGRNDALSAITRFLPNIEPAISTVQSGFCDGSGLVEVPALLLGGPAVSDGRPAVPDGARPLPENSNFRTLIGEEHRAVMTKMAQERIAIAAKFGVRNLPGLDQWLEIHAGAAQGDGTRPIPSAHEARNLLRCATVGSLIPMVSAAKVCGIDAPATEAMVQLAGAVLGADMANVGRRLETIGITAGEVEDARRILDARARGDR